MDVAEVAVALRDTEVGPMTEAPGAGAVTFTTGGWPAKALTAADRIRTIREKKETLILLAITGAELSPQRETDRMELADQR